MKSGIKRILILVVSVVLQIAFLSVIFIVFPKMRDISIGFLTIVAFLIIFFIASINMSPDYKVTWMIAVLAFPLLGALIYLLSKKTFFQKHQVNMKKNKEVISTLQDDYDQLNLVDGPIKKHAHYLKEYADSAFFTNNDTKYYPLGEEMWQDLIIELEKAEKFIFMEYFIIGDGKMFNAIADVLKRKAKAGVDVRLMTDAVGSMLTLSGKLENELKAHGVKFIAYNKKIRIFNLDYNNRDHRKITVIDGKVGFTGGVNLADEYINVNSPYGHWKDTAIRIKGSAVNYFTIMFLTLWSISIKEEIDYEPFLIKDCPKYDNDGFVAPYADYPGDEEDVGATMYENMICSSQKYVYITSPYLILDYVMVKTLVNASKSGIDVRIIIPGVPDKIIVDLLAKSFYEVLLKSGVRIFEYTPGYIHSKQFVSDDKHGVIGTINLDYRSLTHHLENAVYLINDKVVADLKKDFLLTQEKSQEIKLEDLKKPSIIKKIIVAIIKIIAPLL